MGYVKCGHSSEIKKLNIFSESCLAMFVKKLYHARIRYACVYFFLLYRESKDHKPVFNKSNIIKKVPSVDSKIINYAITNRQKQQNFSTRINTDYFYTTLACCKQIRYILKRF